MYGPILEKPSTTVRDRRRRSADVGGLHLATENSGQGQGWMGGHPGEIEYVIRSSNTPLLPAKQGAQNYVRRDAK